MYRWKEKEFKKRKIIKKWNIKKRYSQKRWLTEKCTHLLGQKWIHYMGKVEYKRELKYIYQYKEGYPNCINKEYIWDE